MPQYKAAPGRKFISYKTSTTHSLRTESAKKKTKLELTKQRHKRGRSTMKPDQGSQNNLIKTVRPQKDKRSNRLSTIQPVNLCPGGLTGWTLQFLIDMGGWQRQHTFLKIVCLTTNGYTRLIRRLWDRRSHNRWYLSKIPGYLRYQASLCNTNWVQWPARTATTETHADHKRFAGETPDQESRSWWSFLTWNESNQPEHVYPCGFAQYKIQNIVYEQTMLFACFWK